MKSQAIFCYIVSGGVTTMSISTVLVALYDELYQASEVIEELVDAGISREQISLAASDPDGVCAAKLKIYEPGAADSAVPYSQEREVPGGVLVGGLAGALLSLGAYAVPGLRPLVALGPILTGLAAAATGAAAGGIVAALLKWGIPKAEAGLYGEAIRRGCVLVAVTAAENEAGTVARIMDEYQPVDVERRSAYWRAEGWTEYKPEAEYYTREQIEEEQEHYTIYETYEPIFQAHFETHYGKENGRAYRDYAPAYYAGYILGSDMRYRNHSWEELEPEARRRWQTEHSLSGPWEEAQGAVRYAWQEVREDYYGENGNSDV
jgi:hypothetical protein